MSQEEVLKLIETNGIIFEKEIFKRININIRAIYRNLASMNYFKEIHFIEIVQENKHRKLKLYCSKDVYQDLC